MTKTCKNHKPLLVTKLIFCRNPKAIAKSNWVLARGTRMMLTLGYQLAQTRLHGENEDNIFCQLCPTWEKERERESNFNTTRRCTHAAPPLLPPSEVQSANSITQIPVQCCMTNCQPSSHALAVSVWLAEDKWICNSLLSLPPSHLITLTANCCCSLSHTHTHWADIFSLLHQLSLRTQKEKDKRENESEKEPEAEKRGEEINMSRFILHILASF